VNFHFAQRENNNENNKARKKGRYSREKRGVLREIKSHLQISFAASFCFLGGGFVGQGEVFFAQNLRKRRSKRKKSEERKRKRNIALYEKKDNTATTEQRQKSQHSSLALYSSLVYVVYK
jgi:hypothetical protein